MIQSGQRYRYRVAARNKHGWGVYSYIADILAAVVPDAPLTVTTEQNGLYSLFTWVTPAGNGSDIESYDIEIQGDSGSYAQSVTCTGSDPSLTTCSVAYSELRSTTFGLILGETILVRVRAENEIDFGTYSVLNNSGDIVRTEPQSSPESPIEGSDTSDSQIEVTWSALIEPYTGYDTITMYQIYWDNGSDGVDWALIETQETGDFTFTYTKDTGI